MKNRYKVIAVMLACFICIMSIPRISHAASGGRWHWTECSTGWNSTYDDNNKNLNVNETTAEFTNSYSYRSLNSSLTKANVYQCEFVKGELSNAEVYNFYLSSDDEIVLLYTPKNKTSHLTAYSKSEIYGCFAMWKTANGTCGQSTDFSQSSDCKDGIYFYHSLKSIGGYGNFGTTLAGINTYNLKVFDDVANIKNYFETGSTVGMCWDGNEVSYDGNVKFNTFEIIPHDSNSYDAFYFEFRYELPFDMINSDSSIFLDIDSTFEWTGSALADAIRYPSAHYGVNRINLLDYPSGFKLYLDDIEAITNFVGTGISSSFNKRSVLGSEALIDFNLLSIGGVGGNTLGRITNSKIYFDCVLICDGVCGVTDHYDYDFLNGGGNYYSSTPDSDGNYIPDDNYKHTGYYYTNVGTDAAGNTTYNYYYYGDDNSYREISAEDSHNNSYSGSIGADVDIGSGGGGGGTASGDNSNNNVNNPTFNNNNNVSVTVEGDSINNDVDNIINNDTSNSKENSDSFIEKFLGFFSVLENNSFLSILGKLFGWLPAPVYAVITGSIGIVAGVSVFRFFRK